VKARKNLIDHNRKTGIVSRFNFYHPFGVFALSAYRFYSHFTPPGFSDKNQKID